jgi:hypothetical protein
MLIVTVAAGTRPQVRGKAHLGDDAAPTSGPTVGGDGDSDPNAPNAPPPRVGKCAELEGAEPVPRSDTRWGGARSEPSESGGVRVCTTATVASAVAGTDDTGQGDVAGTVTLGSLPVLTSTKRRSSKRGRWPRRTTKRQLETLEANPEPLWALLLQATTGPGPIEHGGGLTGRLCQ